MRKFFNKFSLFELILLAFIAALGVAVKPVVVALTHVVTGPLAIPGGALSGGLYMLFLVLGGALVGKRGAATLVGAVQCVMVLVTGVYGTHGAASIVTYIAPGLAVDLLWLAMRTNGFGGLSCFFGCMVANVTGVLTVNLVFFRLPAVVFSFSAALAAFSGGLGGIIAWNIARTIKKEKIMD